MHLEVERAGASLLLEENDGNRAREAVEGLEPVVSSIREPDDGDRSLIQRLILYLQLWASLRSSLVPSLTVSPAEPEL